MKCTQSLLLLLERAGSYCQLLRFDGKKPCKSTELLGSGCRGGCTRTVAARIAILCTSPPSSCSQKSSGVKQSEEFGLFALIHRDNLWALGGKDASSESQLLCLAFQVTSCRSCINRNPMGKRKFLIEATRNRWCEDAFHEQRQLLQRGIFFQSWSLKWRFYNTGMRPWTWPQEQQHHAVSQRQTAKVFFSSLLSSLLKPK